MPEFGLNKLVRDKLPAEYERLGQKAVYRKLSESDHKRELIRKIAEEALEIQLDDPIEKIESEIADVQQGLDDLITLCSITIDKVKTAQQIKYDKKGGFIVGAFVETIKLADGDEWIDYYRNRPDIFPEI